MRSHRVRERQTLQTARTTGVGSYVDADLPCSESSRPAEASLVRVTIVPSEQHHALPCPGQCVSSRVLSAGAELAQAAAALSSTRKRYPQDISSVLCAQWRRCLLRDPLTAAGTFTGRFIARSQHLQRLPSLMSSALTLPSKRQNSITLSISASGTATSEWRHH